MSTPSIISCINDKCNQKIKLPSNKDISFPCPKCGNKYEYLNGELIATVIERISEEDKLQNVEIKMISFDRLIKGFPNYFKTLKLILNHPYVYPRTINLNEDQQFWKAVDYATYSIIILFLLVFPVYLIHDEKVGKLVFFIRLLSQIALLGALFHFALKIFGAREYPINYTLSIYSYLTSTFMPFYIIALYPFLIKVGPAGLFGSLQDSIEAGEMLNNSMGFRIYFHISNYSLSILSLIVTLKWFSYTHGLTKTKIFFAMSLTGILGGTLLLFLINPLFNKIGHVIEKLADAL
ncbi:hypothetical protein [Aridibaculum aurantiacum]|uniref:hypothetical protein n=1 Tax=Aridibaculum aurantiacum TaxID=2810307 RepID=UPI001A95C28E|nr:hypothetical protein [Aridibaculum aurantiacum]